MAVMRVGIVLLSLSMAADVAGAGGWVRWYSPLRDGQTAAVAAAPNGGFIVAAHGSPNAIIVVNAAGDVRVARAIRDKPAAVAAGPDGAVFVAAADGITKLSRDLTPLWSRHLSEELTSIAAAGDGGVVVAGARLVASLDGDGRVRWSFTLHDASFEDVKQTNDGGTICAGVAAGSPWLAKLTVDGTVEWQRTYGSAPGAFSAVTPLSPGGFAAVGMTRHQALIVRTDATGDVKAAFVPTVNIRGWSVAETPAGYVAAMYDGGYASLAAFGWDDSSRWHRMVADNKGVKDTVRPVRRGFAAASDGVVFAAPLAPGLDKAAGVVRLVKVDEAGGTACENAMNSSTVVVPVPLSSSEATAHLEPAAIEVVSARIEVTPLELNGVADSCRSSAPFRPTGTYATKDPELERANADRYRALLAARDFDALDRVAAELRARRYDDPMLPNRELHQFYTALAPVTMTEAELFAVLRDWVAARSSSITAPVALAHALYRAGWRRRGGDYANTVTEEGWKGYREMLSESARVLDRLGRRGESDPYYWFLRVVLSHERETADVRDVARRALRLHPDPVIAWRAGEFLLPKWGGSPEEVMSFADEAAKLTREYYGDAMYMWFAHQVVHQALNAQTDEEAREDLAAYSFDWGRIRKGGQEALAKNPDWAPSHHRLALLAFMFDDRETARELFSTPKLDYYDAASTLWMSSSRYDRAKKWALPPKEKPKRPVAMPPAPSAPSQPELPPEPWVSLDHSRWPRMLLSSQLTFGGTTHDRIAAFLVETPHGLVVVSAVPEWPDRRDSDNVLARVRETFGNWTIAFSSGSKQATLLTPAAPNPQRGVALAVDVDKRSPFPQPLKIRRFSTMSEVSRSRVFVVGCRWERGKCTQVIQEGMVTSMTMTHLHKLRTLQIGFADTIADMTFTGGAVLDSNGHVIAVATGTTGDRFSGYKTLISADGLDTVLP